MIETVRGVFRNGLLPAFLLAVFLFGGASRSDVLSLIVLRPLAVLALFAALLQVKAGQIRPHRAIATIGLATVLLVVSHLVPLPPALWQAIPGREIVREIDAATRQPGLWRPFSLSPDGTWNAFYSLSVPIAAFLMAIRLDLAQRVRLFALLLLLGMASAVLGILQLASSGDGPLYLYAITNKGSAVGLFANRNHQAVMLAMLFPMIGALAAIAPSFSIAPSRLRWLLVGCAALLQPLLLITGSRLGLAAGGLGAVLGLIIYWFGYLAGPVVRTASVRTSPRWRIAGMFGGLIVLTGLTALLARAEAIRRLIATSPEADLRLRIWGPIWDQSMTFFPWGSGIGSFVPVYKLGEARENLQLAYVNHAHNDWLELWLTAGVPGIAILIAALIWLSIRVKRLSAMVSGDGKQRVEVTLGFAALACLILIMVGSLGDYPLRTPIFAAILPILLVFMQTEGLGPLSGTHRTVQRPG